MSRRTTTILGGIAVAMALFIWLFESGSLTTGELAARRGRVIQSFVRPRVEQVVIEHGDRRIVLHRERGEEDELEALDLGHWRITEPIESDADQDEVDQLLSSLEWLEARRSLEGITDEDRTTFGLAEPAAQVRYTVADRTVTVSVGGDDPIGDGVYVSVDDQPDRAWIVGRDFVEALDHDVDHFRRKELFSGVRSGDASAVELRNADTEVRVEREGGRWWLREPVDGLARVAAIDQFFTLAHDLRATRFLDEDSDDLSRYGLDSPTRELVIRRERTDQEDEEGTERDRTPVRLRIGGACADHEGESTAIAGEDGPVVCVSNAELESLDVGLDRLRETRLVAMRDDELETAEIDGTSDFELRRIDEGWSIVTSEGDDEGERIVEADPDAIGDWMRALRAQEATAFENATTEALRARGLDSPRATLTLHRADADRTEIVQLGTADGDGFWARRGDEPQIGRYPAAVGVLVSPSAVQFRRRELVHDTEGNARRLAIVRGTDEEILEREGSVWSVTAPAVVAADRVVARDVVRALATLTAVRFVADRASAEHGLDRPRFVVSGRFEGALPTDDEDGEEHEGEEADAPREIMLSIGSATEGGAFARLGDDPAVFVVPGELVDDVSGPLASRDLLATETSQLESLTIARGGVRIELRREGEGWTAGQGPADLERTTTILDRLASLRASGTTAYGAGAAIRAPTLTLEVARRSGTPQAYSIVVGTAGAPGEDGWYNARRSDLEIGYRIPASVVREFLEYAP